MRNFPLPPSPFSLRRGFTIIELLVVMGLLGVFLAFITPNLVGIQQKTNLDEAVQTLIADLRLEQAKAMTGDRQGQVTTSSYGIYFDPNDSRYILFRGASYNPNASDNFVVTLPPELTFSNVEFASSQIVFSKLSGEVAGFVDGDDSVTLQNTATGEEKVIQINRFGAPIF